MKNSHKPIAIVTGAGGGIGLATVKALKKNGFYVAGVDIDFKADFSSLFLPIKADIAQKKGREKIAEVVMKKWGAIDCLVNNAGVSVMHRGDIFDVSEESFARCFDINCKAMFFLTQKIARIMIDKPSSHYRSIINITSSNAKAVSIDRSEYCVSKAAASMVTQNFSLRLASENIGVYEIRPGIIETDMTKKSQKKYDAFFAQGKNPIARWGHVDEVAAYVIAAATGMMPYSVGQVLEVDGGLTKPAF